MNCAKYRTRLRLSLGQGRRRLVSNRASSGLIGPERYAVTLSNGEVGSFVDLEDVRWRYDSGRPLTKEERRCVEDAKQAVFSLLDSYEMV